MINAQEYLDNNYPKKNRSEIKELNISGKELVGRLVFEGFTNLEKIKCSSNQITSLEFIDSPNLWEIDCQKNKLTRLKFGGLKNLVHLKCSNNQLIELDVSGCPSLCSIECENNLLTNLDLSGKWGLWKLWIGNNRFTELDLSFLKHLFNLTTLKVNGNQFIGSLKPLRVMDELNLLDISDTDIDSGLEYLPKRLPGGVGELDCSTYQKPGAKVKAILQELKKFGEPKKAEHIFWYDHLHVSNNFADLLKDWRNINSERVDLPYQESLRELINLKKLHCLGKENELVDFKRKALKESTRLRSEGKPTWKVLKEQKEEQKVLEDKITWLKAHIKVDINKLNDLKKELRVKQQEVQVQILPKTS